MKKSILILAQLLLAFSLSAQISVKMPTLFNKDIKAINDSIAREGLLLYHIEKANGIAAEEFAKTGIRQADVTVNAVKENIISTAYLDSRSGNCLYVQKYNTDNQKVSGEKVNRPMTLEEKITMERDREIYRKLEQQKGRIRPADVAMSTFTYTIVPISDKLTRVYILTHLKTDESIIPFGNDYSFDFDNLNNLVDYRKYHADLAPVDVSSAPGERITVVEHTHTGDNHYITPTDIAIYMLYGRDKFKITSFKVNCPEDKCAYRFNPANGRIMKWNGR